MGGFFNLKNNYKKCLQHDYVMILYIHKQKENNMNKENRNKFIQVPVRESERAKIKELAEEQGLPMSIYMRNLALKGEK